jgi:hypothetical protein
MFQLFAGKLNVKEVINKFVENTIWKVLMEFRQNYIFKNLSIFQNLVASVDFTKNPIKSTKTMSKKLKTVGSW